MMGPVSYTHLDVYKRQAVTGEIESRPYIGLPLAVLNAFGVQVDIEESATPGGLPLTVFTIERHQSSHHFLSTLHQKKVFL